MWNWKEWEWNLNQSIFTEQRTLALLGLDILSLFSSWLKYIEMIIMMIFSPILRYIPTGEFSNKCSTYIPTRLTCGNWFTLKTMVSSISNSLYTLVPTHWCSRGYILSDRQSLLSSSWLHWIVIFQKRTVCIFRKQISKQTKNKQASIKQKQKQTDKNPKPNFCASLQVRGDPVLVYGS